MDGHRPKLICEQELLWAFARLMSISLDFLFYSRRIAERSLTVVAWYCNGYRLDLLS